MKRIYMFLLCAIFGLKAFANDVIVLKDNTRIDAKIEEVSSSAIKYRMVSNLDGPVFVQETDQIAVIIYDNGTVKTYNNADSKPASAKQASTASAATAANSKAEEPAAEDPANDKKIKFNPTPSDKFVVGLTVGYVSKSVKETDGVETEKGSFLLGRHGKTTPVMRFGLTINPTFKYGIGIRTGVFMEYGREKGKISGYNITAHDINVSLPVQLSYRYELIKNLSFMIYTGPVFDFGAYAFTQADGSSNKSKNLYSVDGYKGFNALWGIGAGVQWSRLRLDVGGEFGMSKKNKESDYYATWNKPFYITLTCML